MTGKHVAAKFFLLAAVFAAAGSLPAQKSKAEAGPRVFLLDAVTLVELKQRYASDSNNALTVALRIVADRAMKDGPFSVMDKKMTPPSGDKHDYMSMGTYWWPNPKTPNGLPYIRRDGERNPEIETIPDHQNMGRVGKDSRLLALAFYLTGDETYAARAALTLRTWFLDPATHMNPNLNFGQGVPGITTGRGTGIIDSRGLTDVVDAVGLLAGSRNWKPEDQKGMEKWFADYLSWLQQSPLGQDEAKAVNNHGTFYDVQVADFALFTGQSALAHDVISQAKEKRLARQVMPDGSQPLESERTRGLSYSLFNLEGLMKLADLGDHTGVDLWNFQTTDGRSIHGALDYVLPFAAGEKKWEHQQISDYNPQEIVPLLLQAAHGLRRPEYESAARKLGAPGNDVNNLLLLAQLHR